MGARHRMALVSAMLVVAACGSPSVAVRASGPVAADAPVSAVPTSAPSTTTTPSRSPAPSATTAPSRSPAPSPAAGELVFGRLRYDANSCFTDTVTDAEGHRYGGAVVHFSGTVRNAGQASSGAFWLVILQTNWLTGTIDPYGTWPLGYKWAAVDPGSIAFPGQSLKAGESRAFSFSVFFEEPSRVEWRAGAFLGPFPVEGMTVGDITTLGGIAIHDFGSHFTTVTIC